MARHLGALFSEAARAPLHEADRQLESGALEAALAELTRDRLIGAVRRGVELVAKAAGVAALRVFQRLPMPDLEERVDQLEADQFLASEALRGDGSVGSSAAAAAAQQVPRPVASGLLRQIASTDSVRKNRELATALHELADDVDSWDRALERCRSLLDDATDLARKYRKRRLTRIAVLALVPLVLGGSGAWFGHQHIARSRIDAKLAQGACAAEQLNPRERAQASEQQLQAIERGIKACRQQREEQRREEEARRLATEKRAAADKLVQERLERCKQYEQRFRDNQLNEADDQVAGAQGPLVRRLAQGVLKPEDVEAELGELPCKGTPAAKTIGSVYSNLVAAGASAWLATRTPSKSVRQLVVEHRDSVDVEALKHLGGHIDVAAKQAVRSGQKRDIERFAELCRWKRALGLKQFGNCIAVLQLADGK